MASGNLVPRVYGGFRGVDFRGEEINLVRSPDSLNMWKDYKETDSIRTRPEFKKLFSLYGTVWGIYPYGTEVLIHCGPLIYVMDSETKELLRILIDTPVNNGKSDGFIYEGVFYFIDGENFYKYDGETFAEVEGYIPTTTISKSPSGAGKTHEDVNMLTTKRKNSFVGDGESTVYVLDAQELDRDFTPIVTVNDEPVTDFEVNHFDGKITFTTAPPKPLTDGQDNVIIEFKVDVGGYLDEYEIQRDKITKCTMIEFFDNRVFFSGNPDYPNVVWHSSLDNPEYCSDLDYIEEGIDDAKIKGMVAGNNALWVFREPSQSNTSIFYHTPTIDSDYGKIYPSVHSSIALGCVGAAINFNDDIVFFSQRGMEGINGDITTEQAVAHRSSLIDRKLNTEIDYSKMVMVEWEGYLLVFVGKSVYLADSRAMFQNENHFEYEWFYWEWGAEVTCATVHNGVLYVGTRSDTDTPSEFMGVFTLTDFVGDVESYWVTPKDKFNYPQYLKTTNKRGCVTEATGDVDVYVKTNKTDFEKVSEHKNVLDAFVSRIKRKKFKDIQLKFHSKTRFSLEQATLECFVGGYIKR